MRNLYYRALLGVFSLLACNATLSQVQTARYISITPNSGAFYEYLPQGYDITPSTEKYPLIIFLHGLSEQGNGNEATLRKVLRHGLPRLISENDFPVSFVVGGKTYRFIVLSPQFKGWPSPGDINKVISFAIANYKVDPSRVYLTGLSMGGGAVWEYGGNTNNATYARRVAAIAPMCGAAYPSPARANVISINKLAVWAFHNDKDPTAPVYYTNDMVNLINSNSRVTIPARKTIFNSNKHDCWTQAYSPAYREDGANVFEWMLGYKRSGEDNDIVLPLNWLDFTGIRHNENALLNWSTANEMNTDLFIIERSLNGTDFESIGVVDALGSSASPNRYSFADNKINVAGYGMLYYRIKQVDDNGRYTYSKVVVIKAVQNAPGHSIASFPNPFSKTLVVQIATAGAQDHINSIEVFSLQGALVYQKLINKQGNLTLILDDLANLSPGIYIFKATINKISNMTRILKE